MVPVGRLESAKQIARERTLDGAILEINLMGRPCFPVAKPFEPKEMKEMLADMLGIPRSLPLPERRRSSIRH